MKELSIFIFRRDLRLEDNTALIKALKESKQVIPIFIFNDEQLKDNPLYNSNIIEFMTNSLTELNNELKKKGSKLYTFYGNYHNIIKKLITNLKPDAIYLNKDYTPFAIKRDEMIKEICMKNNIDFIIKEDYLLHDMNTILKDDKNPYTIFTPFFKKSLKYKVNKPITNKHNNYYNKEIELAQEIKILKKNEQIFLKGGRKEALNLLNEIKNINKYNIDRNYPSQKGTTYLSAHHKFGTISIRESYYFIINLFNDNEHALIRELYWRDFFTQIAYNFPKVFEKSFNPKYENIKWNKNEELFNKWKNGMTGFPIIDAGIRELNTTGYMHNRVRMIVASFLTKDLHISWKEGEEYFAKKLIDYDPSVNNGSWQWSASTGCDAQPYFRIFNPWTQQKTYDENCGYIKKWVKELKDLTPKQIHNLEKYRPIIPIEYPKPCVEHKIESKIAIEMFKEN